MDKNIYKSSGRLAGIAFIIGTAAGVSCLSFVNVINTQGYLNTIAQNPANLAVGAFLIVIMALACASIAYAIYPVLSKHNKYLAIGAVGYRSIEAALTTLSAVTLFALVPIAKDYAQSGSDILQSAADTMVYLHGSLSIGLSMAFILGAMLYNIGFYKYKLVPRWLSLWGIIALALHLAEQVMVIFGLESFSAVSVAMNMPIALQEMVMAVYLIIFGFRRPAEN